MNVGKGGCFSFVKYIEEDWRSFVRFLFFRVHCGHGAFCFWDGELCSEEVVFALDCRKVIFCFTLGWRCECLETSKSFWVMDALLEKVELRLTDTHLSVHLKEALSCIIERIIADWLELQVLWVASQHIKSFSLWLFWVTFIHAWCGSLFLVVDDLPSALVKVNVEENHLLHKNKYVSVKTKSWSMYRTFSCLCKESLPRCLARQRLYASQSQPRGPYENIKLDQQQLLTSPSSLVCCNSHLLVSEVLVRELG